MIGKSENDIALQLEGVTVAFGGIVAVNNVSIVVPRGMRGTIIGPNGAGKTTLFRTISGETAPTKGRIRLFGEDVTKWPSYRRARSGLGRTYQVTNIFNELTVEQNVTLAALGVSSKRYQAWLPIRMTGELAQRVDKALIDVHIEGLRNHPANMLSHGQQRQLELAIAMVSNPQLLLLDEPAAGLTSSERKTIVELISSLPRDITILIIEHDLDLAFGISERITCMNYGQIIADGTPAEIRDNKRVQEVYIGG
jgi:branched-chain amino acid transport system ATP-binding protein